MYGHIYAPLLACVRVLEYSYTRILPYQEQVYVLSVRIQDVYNYVYRSIQSRPCGYPLLTVSGDVGCPGGGVEVVEAGHHVAETAHPVQGHVQDEAELEAEDEHGVDGDVVLLGVHVLQRALDAHHPGVREGGRVETLGRR